MNITSIVLAGVGGQGILLASRITSRASVLAGYDVKLNEVHGMAQRGGSVIAQIRYGKEVYSPLVCKGGARVLMALEQVEALRYADYLAPEGLATVSDQTILPVTVSSGKAVYPSDIYARLQRVFRNLQYIPAADIAAELGNSRAANTVLLGAMSKGLDLETDCWHQAIAECLKPATTDMNIQAFNRGRNI
ncbi:MAG: indolepyruvate oxidoreductase subunit beta [Kiritimatiellia bacterium]